jgi:hypothetical protein
MLGGVEEEGSFDHLMKTRWFPETIERYFGGEYRRKYDETMARLKERGAVSSYSGVLKPLVPA